MSQDQLVAGTGHGHVEQAAFLLEVMIALRQPLPDQFSRHRQRIAPIGRRKAPVDQPHNEDGPKLEAFGLVHGEHRDGIGLSIKVRRRRIVTCLDQRLEVTSHEDATIIGQHG